MSGNTVSHANNKNRRKFEPNLHVKRFWSQNLNRFVRMRVSARAIKTIDKLGVDQVLADMAKRDTAL